MRWGIAWLGGLVAALAAAPAHAQNRSFCAEKPGMGSPACTLGGGQAMVEVTVAGLDHTNTRQFRLDVDTFADTLLRFGLDDRTEVQLGLTGYIRAVRSDRRSGVSETASGIGDSYVAVRRSLSAATAIEAYILLPTGQSAVSAGTWGAGVVLPISLPSPAAFQLALTPEFNAVPGADGRSRHFVYGAVLGASTELASGWAGALEVSAIQNDEPFNRYFGSKLAATLTWRATERLQFNTEFDLVIAGPRPRTIALFGFALRL